MVNSQSDMLFFILPIALNIIPRTGVVQSACLYTNTDVCMNTWWIARSEVCYLKTLIYRYI